MEAAHLLTLLPLVSGSANLLARHQRRYSTVDLRGCPQASCFSNDWDLGLGVQRAGATALASVGASSQGPSSLTWVYTCS